MSLRDFERPSCSNNAWPLTHYWAYSFGSLLVVPPFLILVALFETPHTEFTSVRLGESVEDGRTFRDIRTFASGSDVGIHIAYDYGNANRLEVVLADRSGKAIDGLANTCSKFILGNQGGDYQCAFQAVPAGKYEIQLWLSGAIKRKYLLEVNPAPGGQDRF